MAATIESSLLAGLGLGIRGNRDNAEGSLRKININEETMVLIRSHLVLRRSSQSSYEPSDDPDNSLRREDRCESRFHTPSRLILCRCRRAREVEVSYTHLEYIQKC
jgi:hypothetical protein